MGGTGKNLGGKNLWIVLNVSTNHNCLFMAWTGKMTLSWQIVVPTGLFCGKPHWFILLITRLEWKQLHFLQCETGVQAEGESSCIKTCQQQYHPYFPYGHVLIIINFDFYYVNIHNGNIHNGNTVCMAKRKASFPVINIWKILMKMCDLFLLNYAPVPSPILPYTLLSSFLIPSLSSTFRESPSFCSEMPQALF